MTKTNPTEELRSEWIKHRVGRYEYEDSAIGEHRKSNDTAEANYIADWWLAHTQQQKEELIEKIKKQKDSLPLTGREKGERIVTLPNDYIKQGQEFAYNDIINLIKEI